MKLISELRRWWVDNYLFYLIIDNYWFYLIIFGDYSKSIRSLTNGLLFLIGGSNIFLFPPVWLFCLLICGYSIYNWIYFANFDGNIFYRLYFFNIEGKSEIIYYAYYNCSSV